MLLLITTLATGGCASLSQTQCVQGDWYGIGHEDAWSGHTPDRVQAHAKACAEYAVVPKQGRYREGFEAGLLEFCTAERGFEFGREGGYYAGTCPASVSATFLAAYRQGRALYRLERDIVELELEQQRLESLLLSSVGEHSRARRHRLWLRHRLLELDYALDTLRFELLAHDRCRVCTRP
ncbi:MAG: DUF2799 domain-containing protein [Gammaproteobacteria bacterium]|nr:DUF2799 domain-containing protein [Gammaproteobacteria bacterium]